MNAFAASGEMGTHGNSHHFVLSDTYALRDACSSITTHLIHECVVPLRAAPIDRARLNLAIDCIPVPASNADGTKNWYYDGAGSGDEPQIVISGAKCEFIQQLGAKRIDVVSACAEPILP